MLSYRSFSDLGMCIAGNLSRIPADVDLIVGIPGSGLMVASLVALHLNRSFTSLDQLVEGRVLSSGMRLKADRASTIEGARRIAVVDDSICSGREMQSARARIHAAGLAGKTIFVAAYATERAAKCVDIYFEICPMPRVFAWNMMHRRELEAACVDIDGVLCLDPTDAENDDGPCYQNFLANTRPLYCPTYEIGTLVTCRLERYRAETERWLEKQGIRYRELVMWDLPNKTARVASGGHAQFKSSVFRARTESNWFIESSASQAQEIANLALKPVICIETQSVYNPGMRELALAAPRNFPTWFSDNVRRALMMING